MLKLRAINHFSTFLKSTFHIEKCSGPLACHKNNAPFTRSKFEHQLKNQHILLNYNKEQYNTHCFGRGITTDMHTLGASNSQIEKIGRWHSNAFKNRLGLALYTPNIILEHDT